MSSFARRWPASAGCGGASPAPANGTACPSLMTMDTTRSRSPPSCARRASRARGRSSPSFSRTATPAWRPCSSSSRPASTTPTPLSSRTSTQRARRRLPAPIAIRWCRVCVRTGIGRLFRSTARRSLRASSNASRSPAISWCVSARATSPNGRMHCRESSPRWERWPDGDGDRHSARCGRWVAMTFPDLSADLKARIPNLRGRLLPNQPLAELTWFRVGGSAQIFFMPEDESDLVEFLAHLSGEIPVCVIGLGSNLIVRDGGVPGVVIRLGRGFGEVKVEGGWRIRAGTAAPDVKISRAAQEAAIAGLAFFRGIPGAVGGALRMNGGAYGRETKDALIEARGVDRQGRVHVFSNGDMHYSYRHCGAPDDVVFTEALFQGASGNPADIAAEMEKITEAREATQPIKSRTGGSTFKNPPGHKAWQLIDAAGCRGLKIGDAQVSPMHCNFLINLGSATAAHIEILGETVRRRVKEHSGVDLEWEIKRIGVA